VTWNSKKGKEYRSENGDTWRVAGKKGVERHMQTGGTTYYLPDGPEVNVAYRLKSKGGRLYVVPGGRWVNQNKQPGHVMIFDGEHWLNITDAEINAITKKPVLDLTDIAVDPQDSAHYFVTSYGTGLYEFKADQLSKHYTPSNSIIGAAAPNNPDRYTRTDAVTWDEDGNAWIVVAGGVDTSLVCIMPDGKQRGLNLNPEGGEKFVFNTPGGILIDGDRKWVISSRSEPAVVLLDDGGTKFDASDDQCKVRGNYIDQDGSIIDPEYFYSIAQAPNGDIWIGSESGPIILERDADVMNSNTCKRLRIKMEDETYLLETERVNAFAWDDQGQIWIGTQTGGVYVLNEECTEILACYTSDNSVMPSNTVMTMAYDHDNGQMYIGTANGLVSYIQDPPVESALKDGELTRENNTGNMYRWRAHNAFTYVENVVKLGDLLYGVSAGSLFAVDGETGIVSNITKLDGLSASGINKIAKNESLNRILITYQDGEIDVVDAEGEIHPIMDLYLKQMNGSKVVNDVCTYKDKAYLAMSWGILVINMLKAEIEDTYYIGNESSEVDVQYICTVGEKVYAMTSSGLYCANMRDNLVDYAYWNTIDMPTNNTVSGMREFCGMLFMVIDGKLWKLQKENWMQIPLRELRGLHKTDDNLWLLPVKPDGIGRLPKTGALEWFVEDMVCHCIVQDGNQYWIGTEANGLVKYNITSKERECYYPEGPCSNFAYKLRFVGDRLYMLPGGRWADRYKRKGDIMIYEKDEWRNIRNSDLVRMNHKNQVLDLMNIAQDPKDEKHYFVTSYGTGLYEMYEDSIINTYLPSNSPLMSADEKKPTQFTRTDAITYDKEGNLWLLNVGGGDIKNIHVITSEGKWRAYQAKYRGKSIEMHTPGEIMIDQRNPKWKWIPLLRYNTGLILLDDNGTPTNENDDMVTYRTEFVDQNKNHILPNQIYTIAQDKNNVIWIGTDDGILAIPPQVDFTKSNSCIRVIIPRNDGTNLGDYLLDNEQINDIQIDGANRLWVGTANSGIFLLEPTMEDVAHPNYYVETVAHFTTENSILPSDAIMSIAIQQSTGEVFIGTGGGLVSYMSDASEPENDLKQIEVYPNPVRPDYGGYITFKGLMENTELRIVDANGSLVRVIQSNGGTATWDAKNAQGGRVASGVYTAIGNTQDGQAHGTVKVLIMN
jgi:ligand-binding sensor domain-containing protein